MLLMCVMEPHPGLWILWTMVRCVLLSGWWMMPVSWGPEKTGLGWWISLVLLERPRPMTG